MLLALDTATQFASIALYDGMEVRAELNWRSNRRHTVELAPQVDNLLRLAGITPDEITGLAVGIGPGSYTGTRIALSYAKGIVLARALPLVGIPTLDALAYPHLPAQTPICALVAAGRGRFAWALYRGDTPLPQRTSDFHLDKLPDLLPRLEPPILFAGELDADAREYLRQRWGEENARVVSPALATRRAGVLAELAWPRLAAGDADDPVSLSPIYLA